MNATKMLNLKQQLIIIRSVLMHWSAKEKVTPNWRSRHMPTVQVRVITVCCGMTCGHAFYFTHLSPPICTACYKQISNFDGVIADCTAVLEVEPNNVKALVRRAQAFEGVERYRFALQDVKTVLRMPFHEVGKANFDLCNGLQHRLQRTVDQLKRMNSS